MHYDEILLSLQKIINCTGILFISFILNLYRMEKLTKSEFGLSSKHELWNRIKEIEDLLRSRDFTILCIQGTFDEINRDLADANSRIAYLEAENAKLIRQNDYLLTLLSSYPQSTTIKFP